MAERWWRASEAMQEWAKRAKQAVDFFEGRQWTAEQIAELARQQRAPLKWNRIAPLVRLVTGYMRNNKSEISYLPANEGPASEEVADILRRIVKQIGEQNQLPFRDAEVFIDGILTGRGWYDTRLDFEDNRNGEVDCRPLDPFSVYVDPDCSEYDVNDRVGGAKFITVSRWASIEEIEFTYGPVAAGLVRPFLGSQGTSGRGWGGFPYFETSGGEVTPKRYFGEVEDPLDKNFGAMFDVDFLDRQRKALRVIDMQHVQKVWGRIFHDLETGDTLEIPQTWGRDQVEKALFHAAMLDNPVVETVGPIRKWRWTVMVGDVVVHDSWSPYRSFTQTGFFPYFRRGFTRGMVEDLIDPQKELNSRKSTEIDMLKRNGAGGWKLHRNGIDPKDQANWEKNASKPGFIGWHKAGATHEVPERIEPAAPPAAMDRLQMKAIEDMREIAGVNEAAMGIRNDKVRSGRAIEAEQRQAVIGVQMYFDNFARSKELLGRKKLELIQDHYREPRIFRIRGENGKMGNPIVINKQITQAAGTEQAISKLFDVTAGKYTVAVDEAPLSKTFAEGQWEELMDMLEKMGPLGQMLMQMRPDLVVSMSSLPRKDEFEKALMAAAGALTAQNERDKVRENGGEDGGPPVGGGPADPGIAQPSSAIPIAPPVAV